MSGDFSRMQILKARAEYDEQAREEQLAQIRGEDKPGSDTVMPVSEAELLLKVHSYAEGEIIGVAEVGDDRGLGQQALVHQNGEVVVTAGWVPTLKGSQAKPRRKPQRSWTVQRPRQIRGFEQS